jgi:hypothetical protein
MELVCSVCGNRIPIDSINIENSFIEICVRDTCVTLLPISQSVINIMNELAYYASSTSSSDVSENVVNIPLTSFLILILYLFFFFILIFHVFLNLIPFDVVAEVFMVVAVLSFFLSLFQ